MGGAFVAIADDITAINYNPAGLAQLIKPEFSFGANYAIQSTSVPPADLSEEYGSPTVRLALQDPYRATAKTISFDYMGGAIPFKIAKVPFVIGLGYQKKITYNVNFNYTYQVNMPLIADPSDTGVQTFDRNWDNSGGMTLVTASLAVRPFEFLHAGMSLNFWDEKRKDTLYEQGHVSLYSQDIEYYFINHDIQEISSYDIAHGVSVDLGILLKFHLFSAGFVYKSPYKADYSTRYSYHDNVVDPDETIPYIFSSGPSTGVLNSPASMSLGVSVKPAELFTLSFDYQFTRWSKSHVDIGGVPSGYPIANPQDTRQLRTGLEYLVVMRRFVLPIRAGGFMDRLIWTDMNGDPIDTYGLTLGVGLALRGMVIDLAGVYHFGSYQAGTYFEDKLKSSRWSILGSISFPFGSQ
jgi:long-subunit fatty acid transport protein